MHGAPQLSDDAALLPARELAVSAHLGAVLLHQSCHHSPIALVQAQAVARSHGERVANRALTQVLAVLVHLVTQARKRGVNLCVCVRVRESQCAGQRVCESTCVNACVSECECESA